LKIKFVNNVIREKALMNLGCEKQTLTALIIGALTAALSAKELGVTVMKKRYVQSAARKSICSCLRAKAPRVI
jgi:hypothetical protein